MSLRVPDFSGVRVLVVGDVMLDRYWQGATSRVSPEAPVPVVRVDEASDRPGGAGNVALNLAALGVQTRLLGITGDDANADNLQDALQRSGVRCRFQRVAGVPTTTKLRVMSRHQQLIRLDFEDSAATFDLEALADRFREDLAEADVVVLSDYGKGCLRNVETLVDLARAAGRPVLVDPKGRDFDRYRGATVVTPNLAEFEDVAGAWRDEGDLAWRAAGMAASLELEYLLLTRSEHGMNLFTPQGLSAELPAQAREVFDVTGAGDTVIALLAAGVAARLEMADAARLANLAAGLVVGKLGAATVSPTELRLAAHQALHGDTGVVDEEQLMLLVADAREREERLVMTNGCFDVLHPGHVAYLRAAAELGDRLIVAVNDDDSVTRLKGEGRPVTPAADRMAVLAGLASVDWVVPFSEDTPERLICRVRPDLLVKGGDYRADEVAGYGCVTESGGEVRILDFVGDHSTTAVLERLRGGP